MILCIAGNNNIAVDILLFSLSIIEKKYICVVLNKNDTKRNTWQKSLGFYADKEGVEIMSIESVQEIKDITFISAQFDKIINPNKFKTKKIFNIHFSYLPEYKGMYPSILPILHCKKETGVTLHKIDNGIDTGDIICQKRIDITEINSQELYFKNLKEGAELVCNNLLKLINNDFKSKPQSINDSTYYSKSTIDFNSLIINPYQTAFQIKRYVNAFNFRVYQLPEYNGFKIYKTQISKTKSKQKPGTILIENDEYFELSSIDYNIKLFKDYYNQLIEYSKLNDFENAKIIIKYIDKIDEIDRNGWTPLIIAAYNGAYDIVKLLLENNANPNAHNLNGTTVLMYAKDAYLKDKNLSIIKILLENGAIVLSVDIFGKTIFDYIDDNELIKCLILHLK